MGRGGRAERRTGHGPPSGGGVVSAEPSAPEGVRVPERTCAGCGKRVPQASCTRFVLGPPSADGRGLAIAFDAAGSSAGRGLWVEASRTCLERACRQGFAKAAKARVDVDVDALVAEIRAALERRVVGLLAGAKRAGHVALGTDASFEAVHEGRAALLVVAADAGGVASADEVTRLAAEGRACAHTSKAELGSIFDRTELALVAVLHEGLAVEVKRARDVAAAFTDSGSHGWRSEVR